MKNKMNIHWGLLGVFIGTITSKVVGSYFGLDGQKTVMFGAILINLFLLIYLAIKKHVSAAIFLFIGLSPIYVMFIGIYLDNMVLAICGLLLFFIVMPILIKIMPYFVKKK